MDEVGPLLFDHSPDAIYFLTIDAIILQANRTACQRMQYTEEELVGKPAAFLHAPETQGEAVKIVARLIQDGFARAEVIHQAKDGTKIPTEINSRVVEVGGDRLILSVARDITERRRAKTDAEWSERRFQLLFESSGTSNSLFDQDCRLVLCNRFCAQLIGQGPPETLVGKPLDELFGPDRGWVFRERMVRVMATGRPETHHSHFPLGPERRWLQTSYSPLWDKDGFINGVQLISHDITESHRLEERLRQTEKLESIGILAGGIAHDFNNLLAGLSGNLELLALDLEARKVEEAQKRLDLAFQVFHRAKALTRQMLTFSTGGLPVTGVHNLAPRLGPWAEFALSGSDLALKLDIADIWSCECDTDQIGQVVGNLVINARQASPPGGTIVVKAENVVLDQPFVRVGVTDQGEGIPEVHLENVFDPFFTTKPNGTGLGLATSRSIVQKHGGWMEIQTAPGQGTTVFFCLPAAESAEVPAALAARTFRGEGVALIMDDDEVIRNTLGALLASMGFEVLAAADGDQALALLDSAKAGGRRVAVVILDLTVPGGMGGVETAARFRERGLTSPILAMSGYSEVSARQLREEGFEGQLAKPFSRQDLNEVLGGLDL